MYAVVTADRADPSANSISSEHIDANSIHFQEIGFKDEPESTQVFTPNVLRG